MLFNAVKVKQLGSGVYGTTYLYKYINDELAVFKFEKIDVSEHESSYWRQVQFDDDVASKNPTLFLTMEFHGIQKNVNDLYKYKQYRETEIKEYPWKLTYCVLIVQKPYLKQTLAKNWPLNPEKNSINFLRFVKTFNALKSNGYEHGDTHFNNWMTDDKDEIWLIDYGTITNKAWEYKYWSGVSVEMDLIRSLRMFLMDPYFDDEMQPKPTWSWVNEDKIMKVMHEERNLEALKLISKEIKSRKSVYAEVLEILCVLFDWKGYISCRSSWNGTMAVYPEPNQPMKISILKVIKHLYDDNYRSLIEFAESKIALDITKKTFSDHKVYLMDSS